MTREELIDQAYRQVQSELAGTPQSRTMGQALIDPRRLRSANSIRAEITGTPMNNSLSNSPNTPPQLLELFKELIKNRSGSPFVVGDIASETENRPSPDLLKPTDRAIKATEESLDRINQSGIPNTGVENQLRLMKESRGIVADGVDTEAPEETITDLKEKRKEAAEVNKQAGVTGGDTEDNTNWFDRLNEKVDLMAMGAAMLAGSSSGKGTAANIGQALQAGLASRNKEQLQEEAKKRADALLAIQLLSAKNKGGFTNQGAKVAGLSSELQGAGIEGEKSELDALATLLYRVDPNIVSAPEASRTKIFGEMSRTLGDNWFSSGGEVDITKAREGYIDALRLLQAGKL